LKDYNLKYKQYAKASVAMDSLVAIKKRMEIEPFDVGYFEERARISVGLGRKDEALRYYAICISKQDSILKDRDRIAASEFAEMLQTNNLREEKNELALKLNRHQMIYLFVILGFAVALIIILTRWSINQRRAKKKLSKAHNELRETYERVEQLSNMKSSFIKNMSHEIRTPLNGIVGFTGIISSLVKENAECTQYTKIIETESKKLLKVLNDVIELSSIESDVMDKQPIAIHHCCLTSIARAEDMKKADVLFEYKPSDENIMVNANEKRLVQVIDNILNNAFKFTAKGKVTMEYHKEEKNTVLTITDSGCGIPEDKHEWVFERFSKVDAFTQGSGLGLSICKLIMEKLGGDICIDESYKEGCRIIITLASPEGIKI
jgi:signal transduction histidine kinase